MELRCVWEHNGDDTLLYLADLTGAFTRGATLSEAACKLEREAAAYCRWLDLPAPEPDAAVHIVQVHTSEADVCDADTDVLFDSERGPLAPEEYARLKALALRSAEDFLTLYEAVPQKDVSTLPWRATFYGRAPRTAREMYQHAQSVNAYYFGKAGAEADNVGDIRACRARGFAALEARPGYMENPVCTDGYGEPWSLKKVLRRFLFHDRIHARALWRMARSTFGADAVPDVFRFGG